MEVGTVEWVKLEFQPRRYQGKIIVSMAHYSTVKKKKNSSKREKKVCQAIVQFKKKFSCASSSYFWISFGIDSRSKLRD